VRATCGTLFISFISLAMVGGCAAARASRSGAMETGAQPAADDGAAAEMPSDLPWDEDESEVVIRDPLEPLNRVIFVVNDRLYFWVLKPVATGYGEIVPLGVRVSMRNFFSNLATPIRLGNCLLQGKFEGAGTEALRFVINTTLGVGGLGDMARSRFDLKKRNEDFGQTLGYYGLGPGIYIVWPLSGPSSVRDTVGGLGDSFLDPLVYVIPYAAARTGARLLGAINEVSLGLGAYESFKKAALDPYVSLRDGYTERRQFLIDE